METIPQLSNVRTNFTAEKAGRFVENRIPLFTVWTNVTVWTEERFMETLIHFKLFEQTLHYEQKNDIWKL